MTTFWRLFGHLPGFWWVLLKSGVVGEIFGIQTEKKRGKAKCGFPEVSPGIEEKTSPCIKFRKQAGWDVWTKTRWNHGSVKGFHCLQFFWAFCLNDPWNWWTIRSHHLHFQDLKAIVFLVSRPVAATHSNQLKAWCWYTWTILNFKFTGLPTNQPKLSELDVSANVNNINHWSRDNKNFIVHKPVNFCSSHMRISADLARPRNYSRQMLHLKKLGAFGCFDHGFLVWFLIIFCWFHRFKMHLLVLGFWIDSFFEFMVHAKPVRWWKIITAHGTYENIRVSELVWKTITIFFSDQEASFIQHHWAIKHANLVLITILNTKINEHHSKIISRNFKMSRYSSMFLYQIDAISSTKTSGRQAAGFVATESLSPPGIPRVCHNLKTGPNQNLIIQQNHPKNTPGIPCIYVRNSWTPSWQCEKCQFLSQIPFTSHCFDVLL